MNITKYFAAFSLLFVCLHGIGQPAKNYPPEKKITARLNFTGLLDGFDENISIGAEYRLKPQWSAGSDVGYIFHSSYLSESKVAAGVILRPFIRYYPKKNKRGYFEAQIHYKYVSYTLTDWVGRDVINGVPSYEEYTTFHYNKRAFGLNIITGDDENLTKNKRLQLELYIGLGVRFKKQGVHNGSYTRRTELLQNIYKPEYSSLVIPTGFRLLYKMK